MKNFILKSFAVLALVLALAACKNDSTVTTYGGKDSDGDYLTMVLTSDNSKYEIYFGESKNDKNYKMFSKGTYVYQNNGTILLCSDSDGKTKFSITVNGNKLIYDNGEADDEHYAFELKKK